MLCATGLINKINKLLLKQQKLYKYILQGIYIYCIVAHLNKGEYRSNRLKIRVLPLKKV